MPEERELLSAGHADVDVPFDVVLGTSSASIGAGLAGTRIPRAVAGVASRATVDAGLLLHVGTPVQEVRGGGLLRQARGAMEGIVR